MPMHEYQKQMYKKVGVIVALIILPIAGFFIGMQYQKQTTPAAGTTSQPERMSGPQMMANRAIGTVTTISETSITVTDRMSGEDKTYAISSDTTYKDGNSDATAADIQVDDTVMLTLDENDKTKVKTIAVNPAPMVRGSSDSGGNTIIE